MAEEAVRKTDRRVRVLWFVLVVGGLLLLGACGGAEEYPQSALDPAGEYARKTDELFRITLIIAAVVFVFVEGMIIVAVMKYRRRNNDERPKQTHGNTVLEIGWTMLPAIVLAIISVPTLALVFELADVPEKSDRSVPIASLGDEEVLEVTIVGHQFWWEYQYPQLGIQTANELVIPEGETVVTKVTSVDVIHSFWIPRLAGKQDAVPGREVPLLLKADVTGEPTTYYGQCAEYCQLSHANMRAHVVAMPAADFDQWVSEQQKVAAVPSGGDAAAGRDLFFGAGTCSGCHVIWDDEKLPTDAEGNEATDPAERAMIRTLAGPNLTHLFSRDRFAGDIFELNSENLHKWIRNAPEEKPGSIMPYFENLNDDDIDNIVAYLETLQ